MFRVPLSKKVTVQRTRTVYQHVSMSYETVIEVDPMYDDSRPLIDLTLPTTTSQRALPPGIPPKMKEDTKLDS